MALITHRSELKRRGLESFTDRLIVLMPDIRPGSPQQEQREALTTYTQLADALSGMGMSFAVAECGRTGVPTLMLCDDPDCEWTLDSSYYRVPHGTLDMRRVADKCEVLICDPMSLCKERSVIDCSAVFMEALEEQADAAKLTVIVLEPHQRFRLQDLAALGIELAA